MLFATVSFLAAKGAIETEKGPQKVACWYLWGGAEGERVEEMIQAFNKSQSKYIVEGLSVPDMQKIKVAIASGEGPDITDDFSDNVASYAEAGILEPLDTWIANDKYNMSDFIPAALEGVTINKKIYALPISVNLFMLYYNKAILADAGFDGPPETTEELLEMALATTKVEKGNMKVQGFPDFPTVYYLQPMSIACGGNFAAPNGALTPDNAGTLLALKTIVEYRKKAGLDAVLAFNASGAYLTAEDPFISKRQALRIDGPWFGKIVRDDLGIDLNYGVAPLPHPAGRPDLAGSNLIRSSVFYIPANAKAKEGAWAFMSWLHQKQQMAELSVKMGWVPARISSLDYPGFANAPDFSAYAAMAKSANLKAFPVFPAQSEYGRIISDEAEKAMTLAIGADEALKEAAKKSAALK